jgi:Sap, sulfolipid-1-addressing protein
MWGSVLGLALLTVPDALRVVAILLVISRPRPVQNLFAYWVGCLIVNGFVLLVPLMVLHFTPTLRSLVQGLVSPATASSSTVQPIQIGMGVLALLIAALLVARLRLRRRAYLPTPSGDTSIRVQDSDTPTGISRLLGRAKDAATEGGSVIWRLLGRLYNAWEKGSLWVSVLMGLTYVPPQVSIALTIIVASGAAIGTQLSAAIAFLVVMLAVVEITLCSYLIAPGKTEAVLRVLHDWLLAHRRQILIAFFAVLGLWLVAAGLGIL